MSRLSIASFALVISCTLSPLVTLASHPYALALVDGVIWYNESGTRPDTLVRFDPDTASFQSWPIPSGAFTPVSSGTCVRREQETC